MWLIRFNDLILQHPRSAHKALAQLAAALLRCNTFCCSDLVIPLILVIVSESCGCGESGEFGYLGDSFDFGKLVYFHKSGYLGDSVDSGDNGESDDIFLVNPSIL